MADKSLHSFETIKVSDDGRKVTAPLNIDGVPVRLTMPSPLAARLMAALQAANGEAHMRYAGERMKAGEAKMLITHEPKTLRVQLDAFAEKLLLTVDEGHPTQLVLALPRAMMTHLGATLQSIAAGLNAPPRAN